jgi:hypothetical protein
MHTCRSKLGLATVLCSSQLCRQLHIDIKSTKQERDHLCDLLSFPFFSNPINIFFFKLHIVITATILLLFLLHIARNTFFQIIAYSSTTPRTLSKNA